MVDIKEQFNLKNSGETGAKVEQTLNEIREKQVTFDNYKDFLSRVSGIIDSIDTQVENFYYTYIQKKEEHQLEMQDPNLDNYTQQGMVPISLYNAHIARGKFSTIMLTWKIYQAEILNIVFVKISNLMQQIDALEIRKDAIQEMRDMEEKRNALFLEIMTTRLEKYEGRAALMIQSVQDNQNSSMKDIINMMGDLIKDSNIPNSKKISHIENLSQREKFEVPQPQPEIVVDDNPVAEPLGEIFEDKPIDDDIAADNQEDEVEKPIKKNPQNPLDTDIDDINFDEVQ